VLLVLTRWLKPAEIGLVALATTLISAGLVAIDLGLSQALVQRKRLGPLDRDTVFWVTLASGAILSVVMAAAADWAAGAFGQADLSPVLRLSALSLLFLCLVAPHKALLQRDLEFGVLGSRILVSEVIGGAIGVILAASGFGIWSLVARNLTRDSTAALLLWGSVPWRPRLRVSWPLLRELRSFGAAVMGSRALEFLGQSADQLLIGFFAGPETLGYYVVALRALKVVRQFLVESVAAVAFPFFSRLQDDATRLRQTFLTGTRWVTLAAFPAYAGLAVVAPEAMQLLFGEAWKPSVAVLQILAGLGCVQAAGFFPGAVLLALGHPTWRFGLHLVNSVANVAAIVIAVPAGLSAVAAAQVARAAGLFPLSIQAVRRPLGLGWIGFLRALYPASAATASMLTGIMLTHSILVTIPSDGLRLAATISLGAGLYAAALRVFAPSSFTDFARLAGSLRTPQPPS
jgi:PST family polysaccharide transporter